MDVNLHNVKVNDIKVQARELSGGTRFVEFKFGADENDSITLFFWNKIEFDTFLIRFNIAHEGEPRRLEDIPSISDEEMDAVERDLRTGEIS